jgi:integrase/recombinase XerD
MSEVRAHLADYVELRRSMGFVLKEANYLLPSFVAYLETCGAEHVTIELAVAWAISPAGVLAVTRRQRLGAVRRFAEYMSNIDDRTEVPPRDVLPGAYARVTPYLYSDEEIGRLMAAARSLTPTLRALTYETLIGLLAVSGIRVGEAIQLDRDDIDSRRSMLIVRNTKTRQAREVPLHPSTLAALSVYSTARDRRFDASLPPSVFVSTIGTRLDLGCVDKTYRALVAHAGLTARGDRCRPRAHDLRHSFAVKTLIDWHRDGVNVDARMPLLSQVLGHVNPANTYWYLQAAPELFTIIAQRLEPLFEDQS